MKNIYYFVLLIAAFANAQVVTIPDAHFKTALLLSSAANAVAKDANGNMIAIDANNDTQIQVSEALAVFELNVVNQSIQNLTGINAFANLRKLDCSRNPFSVLAIGSLVNLEDLSCGDSQITSLDMTAFSNLKELTCTNAPLTQLNVVGMSNLERLNIQNGQLASFDCTGLASLELLYMRGQNLATVNLTGMPLLNSLSVENNELVALDVSGLPALVTLDAGGNHLTSLNVDGMANLKTIRIATNEFTTLDLAGAVNLEYISCPENHLTTLDFSGFPNFHGLNAWDNDLTSVALPDGALMNIILDLNQNNLTDLDLSRVNLAGVEMVNLRDNPLVSINLKNGFTDDVFFIIDENPNLSFICADESDMAAMQALVTAAGYTNCVISSYCSFAPGGDYNTITGTVKFDSANNGCDESDAVFPNIRVNLIGQGPEGASFTNTAGNYLFYTQAGNFNLAPAIENPSWFTFSPTTATVSFPDNNNNTAIRDFCVTANGIHQDVEISIAPYIPARPGFNAEYLITYKNKGNQALSGMIRFNYDNTALNYVSTTEPTEVGDEGYIDWSYSNLQPFESRSIYVTLHVNSPTDAPPVHIDDVLNFSAVANPIAGDELPNDNVAEFSQVVVGSYDPNNKICMEGEMVSPSEIGNYLHYIINFENTGTAEALNVVVKDSIVSSMFDINSLQILSSSHPVEAKIRGNIAEFIFQGINLEIGGHGNILLKVKTKDNLHVGDIVHNKADIFFDYNHPINTNFANTEFQVLANPGHGLENSVSVYPNPARSVIGVKSESTIRSIQLYDVQGRLLQTKIADEKSVSVDISSKQTGVYFLKIMSDKGIKTEKIIKK